MNNLSRTNPIKPISDESFNAIVGVMEKFFQLSSSCKAHLRLILFEVSYKKGSNILNAGAKQSVLWFTLDGILQEKSVEKDTFATTTTWFWFSYNFIYATPGFFDQAPVQVSVNVVKDSRVAFISYENWKILKETFEETDRITEMIRTGYETARKSLLNEINNLNTVDRYLKYEAEINQLFPHIKLKHIAEYMGMSTDTLGKLRRRFIKGK